MPRGQDRTLGNPADLRDVSIRVASARQQRLLDIGQRPGRIAVRVTEVAVGGVRPCVGRRMHGKTGVPDQEAEQQGKTDLATRSTHASFDQGIPDTFQDCQYSPTQVGMYFQASLSALSRRR